MLRPSGDQRDAVESFLEKITGQRDVGGSLIQRFDAQLDDANLSYEADFEPWLGADVGAFATKFGPDASGAGIVATSDPDAAMSTFERAARSAPEDGKLEDVSYKGIDYDRQGNTSFGVVGDFFVAGTDDAFRATVDTSRGGDSLAGSQDYKAAVADVPDDALASGFADPREFVKAVIQSSDVPAAQADAIFGQLGSAGDKPVVAWLDATSSSAGLTFSAPTPSDAPPPGESLITSFPDDAWLAFGAAAIGKGFEQGLQQLQANASGAGIYGFDQGDLLKQITAQTGIDIENIGSWLTSLSGYASGTSVLSLNGALVFGTSDEDASAQTLSELQKVLDRDPSVAVGPLDGGEQGFKLVPSGAPVEIDFEQRDGKVVVGLGQESVQNALTPSSKLGDSDTFKSATGTLGDAITPSFYLDFQPIASLADLAQSASRRSGARTGTALPRPARLPGRGRGPQRRPDAGSDRARRPRVIRLGQRRARPRQALNPAG